MPTYPGAVRGSNSGRPIMQVLDVLGRRWSLRVLWELRDGPLTFRQLRSQCDEVSPSSLNARLKDLRGLDLIELTAAGYTLTDWGEQLGEQLLAMNTWAERWARGRTR